MTQTQRLYELLKDCEPHRTDEIIRVVYGSEYLGIARIGALVWDVPKNHGVKIDGRHDPDKPSLNWHQSKLNVTTYSPSISSPRRWWAATPRKSLA
jgi:hypothetical protein